MLVNMGRIMKQLVLGFPGRTAFLNIERNRSFTYQEMLQLYNRVSNFLSNRFLLNQGDFYATILDNDNMGLFHPWLLKCEVGAVWIDIPESVKEQLAQIDHALPRLVFFGKAPLRVTS